MLRSFLELYHLVEPDERRFMWLVFALTLAMAATEALGVASVMPFIGVATDPSTIESNALLAFTFDYLGFESKDSFVFALGLFALVLLTGSILLRGIALWAQLRFSHFQIRSISSRLMTAYLNQPYEWFLSRNTADLGAKVLNEVGNVIHGAMYPAMVAVAHFFVAVCLFSVVIVIDPLVAIACSIILGGSYVSIYLFAKKMLARIGQERVDANQERYRVAQDAFNGIKAVKLGGFADHFVREFWSPASVMASRSVTAAFVAELPSLIMQALVFGGMLTVLLYLLNAHESINAALPYLAIYALAGYRILPSLQGIYKSVSQIRFNAPAISLLKRDLYETRQLDGEQRNQKVGIAKKRLKLQHQIVLTDVTYRYPNGDTPALHSINIVVPWRKTVGIVGSTGSGKSTLVDLILGLLKPQSGTLEVDGVNVSAENLGIWQPLIGYVPQQIHLTDDSVAANIAFGQRKSDIDMDAVVQAGIMARIDEFVCQELPNGYRTNVGENGVRLSGGQRQRIGIARALYRNPEILVFDEATSALDTMTEQTIMDSISELGRQKTIILIAHRLSTIRNCDWLYVLDSGRVEAEGTYDQLIQDSDRFRLLAQQN